MTVKKLFAIAIIFIFTLIAWMILGASNLSRTDKAYSELKREVASLYGDKLIIKAPECYTKIKKIKEEVIDNKKTRKEYDEYVFFETIKSNITIKLFLDQRKKGNLWFPTFKANFIGQYEFKIDNYDPQKKYYLFTTLESADSIYNDIILSINEKNIENVIPLIRKQEIPVIPQYNGIVKLSISYNSTGMEQLSYYITFNKDEIAQINHFNLKITTDFKDYDFPSDMMSPIEKKETKTGYELVWSLNKAVTGKDVGLIIPNKLNPGEIVTRVAFFAPVSLLFFFIVIFMLSIIFKINFHAMHYFFLAATFFSFHLMYSYFSDHLDLYLTFALSSIVSLILTITYLRLFAPKIITFIYAPITQFIYLIVFSFSFFFKGMTGVIVTICSVITLFILMQMTGKTNWDEIFVKHSKNE